METGWVISEPLAAENSARTLDSRIVGAKAAQLTRHAFAWTPHFAVITIRAFALWKVRQEQGDHSERLSADWEEYQSELLRAIEYLHSFGTQDLIARSSAERETLRDRGRYDSFRCTCTIESVNAAVSRIWSGFVEQQSPAAPLAIAVILQSYVEPTVAGHLSNERRITQKATHWLCEFEDSLQRKAKHITLRVRSRAQPGSNLELNCTTPAELELRLHSLAEHLSDAHVRYHLEWVWDSRRLWIVQCDPEEECRGTQPGNAIMGVAPRAMNPLHAFVAEQHAKGSWRKIDAVRTFRACGLPTPQVFVLEDPEILHAVASGTVSMELREDLAELVAAPIVIRTDVRSLLPNEHFLLPRTETIRDVDAAIEFIVRTAAQLKGAGVRPGDFCFIANRFIFATACAQAFSTPGVPRVRIDSSWGLPDGLQYYPHDSFEVDTSQPGAIKRRIRCKSEYFDVDEHGNWVEKRAGIPWDWKPSLSDDQLREIAVFASTVANHLKKPVDLMLFVGVNAQTGYPPCLPWYYTTEGVQDLSENASSSRFIGHRVTVSTERDAESLAKQLLCPERPRALSVRLRPAPELVRSTTFLKLIGSLCQSHGVPIELEGSILSHAYYVLARIGVRIRCVDPFHPHLRRQKFGKLVRNLIPLRIVSRGQAAIVQRVSPVQLVRFLKAKAVEEALELNAEGDPEKTFEELADVLEVISTICDLYDRTFEELRAAADTKRNERGGFEQGLVLLETEEVPLVGSVAAELFSKSGEEQAAGRIIEVANSSMTGDEVPRVRRSSSGIRVSLVPPDPSSHRRRFTVPLHDQGIQAVVEYGEKEIFVAVEPLALPEEDRKQLRLPF